MDTVTRIIDFLSFDIPDVIIARKGTSYLDSREVLNLIDQETKKKNSKIKLEVSGPATFSDKLTNGRIYPKKEVLKGANTWLEPYNRPVLKHHASGLNPFAPADDPVGRVTGYKFVSFNDFQGKDCFIDGVIKPHPTGSGALHLTAEITDKDTIEKILDKRLLTTSVGFGVGGMKCSICDHEWILNGPCEHKPGQIYGITLNTSDKKSKKVNKLAYLEVSDIKYFEWSFVNVPAAEGASITSVKQINDALEGVDNTIPRLSSEHLLFDSLTIGNNSFSILEPSMKEVIEISSTGKEDKNVECKACSIGDGSCSTDSDSEEDEEDALYSDEEVAYANVLKSLVDTDLLDYDLLEKEDGLTKEDVEKIINILEDAKLTTRQRKSLKKSQFCHPSARAFPAHDCPHVRAGFRLLNRAKVSESTKAKIRACLNRKNKALGCGVNSKMSQKKDELQNQEQEVLQDKVEEKVLDSEKETDSLAEVEALKTKVSELEKALNDANDKIKALVEQNELLLTQNQLYLAEKLFDLRVSTKHPSVMSIESKEDRQRIIEKLAERSQGSLKDAIRDEEERLETMKRIHDLPRGVLSQEDAGVVVKEDKSQSDVNKTQVRQRPKDYKEIIRQKLQGAN